jgi:hypothetical protein
MSGMKGLKDAYRNKYDLKTWHGYLTEWNIHTLSWIFCNISHCLVERYATESCDWTSENVWNTVTNIKDPCWVIIHWLITRSLRTGKLCLKHLWGYVTRWVGNLTEDRSCEFSDIDMAVAVPTICWRYNLVNLNLWNDQDHYMIMMHFQKVSEVQPSWKVVNYNTEFLELSLDIVPSSGEEGYGHSLYTHAQTAATIQTRKTQIHCLDKWTAP